MLNKLDLPGAEPERVAEEVADLLGEPTDDILRISGKTGDGVVDVLEQLVERVPPPAGDPDGTPRALIFDSEFDQYRGVIAYIRVVDGVFKKGDVIRSMAGDTVADIDDIGFFTPAMVACEQLSAGEVGFIITGIKEVSALAVGDTLTTKDGWARNRDLEPLPGYRDVQPVVFCGLFPIDSDEYPDLRDALEKLELNDAALSWEPEVSEALGFGFRCGFLGLLHMDIVRERLEREYDIELMATMPSVRFDVTLTDGSEIEVHIPSDFPDPGRIQEIREPMIEASILTPKEYIGPIMELCQERRGTHKGMHYLSAERVQLHYDLPLAEIVIDFFDALKSRTRGYASLDYELRGMQASNMVKLDILLARRAGRRAVDGRAPRQGLRGRALADREAQGEDPAPAVRRPDPGGDRREHRRARDRQGLPQGRHRRLLRRRHHAQAQAAREAEGGQEAHEEGRPHRGPAGGVPRGARARRLRPRRISRSAGTAIAGCSRASTSPG